MKNSKQLERHFKGLANYQRIDILLLLSKRERITLEGIAGELRKNFKTVSEHARRLVKAGLLNKKYRGRFVEHTLSPYGKVLVNFLKSFQGN